MSNFRLFQTERDCGHNFNFDENGRKFFKWVIFPFPTVLSKVLYCRHACKNQGLFGKGLNMAQKVGFAFESSNTL